MFNSLDLLRQGFGMFKDGWLTRLKSWPITIAIIFLHPLNLAAQTQSATEYQLKAAFIYNFTRFVDWPPSPTPRSNTAPFVISVLNEDRLADRILELVKGEQLNGRPIIVRRLDNRSEIANCNILYVSVRDASDMKNQLTTINRRGILTVSDNPNFARWGGLVRFFKEDNKLRMQINIEQARAARFSMSSKLLSISSIYNSN